MTLVIAGFEHEPGLSFNENLPPMEPSSIFICCDSAITAPNEGRRKTLLNGFKKSYQIPVRVWKPYFIESDFHSYRTLHIDTSCLFAIAGSTLISQHVINVVTNHLSNLKVSFKRNPDNTAKYYIAYPCEQNPLEDAKTARAYDDSMFTPKDYENLFCNETILKCIHHSIKEAIKSARKYCVDHNDFERLNTEFIAAAYNPENREYKLSIFRIDTHQNNDFIREHVVLREDVETNRVAVIGLRHTYEAEAQRVFRESLENRRQPSAAIFTFINRAIDEHSEREDSEIAKPSFLKIFERGKLSIADRQP